jgi:hypothetical protein
VIADGHVPATLLIVIDPSGQLSADDLTERRHGIVSYLVDHGYIRSGDDLVSNSADAEQIIQATLADDGSFELNIYDATHVAHREIFMDPSGNPEYVFYPGDMGYYGDGFNPYYLAIVPIYPIWHERHWNPHDHGHDHAGYEPHHPPPIKHGPPPQPPHNHPGDNHDHHPQPPPQPDNHHPQPPGPGHKPDDDHGHGGPPDHKPGLPPPQGTKAPPPATPPSGQQGNRSGQPYPYPPVPPPHQPNNTHPQPPPPNGNGKPDNHPPSDQQGNHHGQPPPTNPKPASPPPSNNKPVNTPPARTAPPAKASPPPPKATPPPHPAPPPPPPKNDNGDSDNTQGKTQQR